MQLRSAASCLALSLLLTLPATPSFAGGEAAPADPAAASAPAPDTAAPAASEPTATPEAAPPAAEAPAAAAPATGSAPAYVGTWADDAAQCAVAQDDQKAPMILTEKGFDQHEAHCTFDSVEPSGASWKVAAKCSVEGDEQTTDFTLSVTGDTLTMGDDSGTHDMMRCK